MAAPIVYRWDDANAPVARGERRSLCDILYACLVTGYGAKPSAGWTREFVNATFDKAVFRPGAGTRFFLQVDGAGAANAYRSNILGFESMSSVDNGLGPFTSGTTPYVSTSSVANTTARPWILIADDRALYFVCWHYATSTPDNATTYASGFFFGDIVALNPSDNYACGISSYTSTAYTVNYGKISGSSSATGGGVSFPRNSSGVASPIIPALVVGGGPSDNLGNVGQAYVPGGALYIARPHVSDGVAHSIRGFMPGFYYPCHSLGSFNQFDTVSTDGKTLLYLTHLAGGESTQKSYFISLDDWRA